jgi:superfamily I DNA/RNA helicase
LWETLAAIETAIIARSNAPLLATAMELLKNGIQFQIVGREFLDEIMKFIKNITGLGKRAVNYQIGEFRDKIADYVREKEEAYKGKIKKKDELEEITTIGNALQGVLGYLEEHNWQDPIDHSHVSDAYSFMDFLRKRFGGLNVQEDTSDSDKFEKNKEKAVTLTTGHRSKGLEFDRVYIIRNDMYDNHKGDTPEDIQQEKHGQYVAYTRAKKQLHVVNDKNPGG